ncbi:hypothetical protein RRG08_051956 [Elysia crispata]|uniref:Uncharacterized protein n=1 Tax=Elysia crispata TaxID=231223 RepID=A0AAE0Y2X4_9GAST|nr:hypothetical protein RRG08_051956 [Elysia crispata]
MATRRATPALLSGYKWFEGSDVPTSGSLKWFCGETSLNYPTPQCVCLCVCVCVLGLCSSGLYQHMISWDKMDARPGIATNNLFHRELPSSPPTSERELPSSPPTSERELVARPGVCSGCRDWGGGGMGKNDQLMLYTLRRLGWRGYGEERSADALHS